jgi:hypothetical protein
LVAGASANPLCANKKSRYYHFSDQNVDMYCCGVGHLSGIFLALASIFVMLQILAI